MAVQNRIVKVQKRNRALVKFDADRIRRAIFHAAESIGGFAQDFLPDINDKIFQAHGTDDKIAEFLADAVVVCLNSDPHHLIANFPPTIETIQDEVLHALRSYGFQNTADAYACYRWGRHWLRAGAIAPDKFVGNGFPANEMKRTLEWNRQRGCDTVAWLNEIVRAVKIKGLVAEALRAGGKHQKRSRWTPGRSACSIHEMDSPRRSPRVSTRTSNSGSTLRHTTSCTSVT